ncbi:MAG TPA: glycosyltransferase family 39 protein [Candidatus Binatia bacterium]|nr:glycosyltransferase family 39 protein [Candidatus Binatia bacterium]
MTAIAPHRLLRIATVLVLAWAAADRVLALGRLPGINGDEAWYAVQLLRWGDGELRVVRTPTGNIPGPLHLGMLWAGLALLPNQLWVLRLPSLVSSVAACGVLFATVRRHFDLETAVIGLLLLACMPVAIVYARLGWDASHGPLLGALMLWSALEPRPMLLAVLFAFALWNHPTNVFAAPFLAAVLWSRLPHRTPGTRALWATAGLAAATPVLLWSSSAASNLASRSDWVARLLSPDEWLRLLLSLFDFLSGAASIAYVAGPDLEQPGTAAGATLVAVVIAAVVAGRGGALPATGVAMLVGFAASVLIFAVVAGTRAVTSHSERYAMVLVTPAVVCAAMLLRRISASGAARVSWRRGAGWTAALMISAAALVFVQVSYFGVLHATGSLSHRTFWTGQVEPKQAAWESIASRLQDEPADRRVVIAADDWWSHQPLVYLAWRTPRVTVRRMQAAEPRLSNEIRYLVGFDGGPIDEAARSLSNHTQQERWTIPGTGRDAVLHVIRLE